ncbi:MAG: shikimate dehydrogenase [Halobacteriota archaeon]|nr:shikimate dehydrogenase [Halobacteriota archaeon]
MKTVYGVIGDPIEHSLSPVMHNAAFEAIKMDSIYLAFRVRTEDVEKVLSGAKSMGMVGLNVTVPLKEKVMEYVELDPLARKIGAVNTVDLSTGIGYNTDGMGVRKALEEKGVLLSQRNVILVGAGGAARAIAFLLAEEGAIVTIVNRTRERAISLADTIGGEVKGVGLDELEGLIGDADILINSTTVGMHPNVNESIVSSDMMHSDLVVFDIVYNPIETKLISEARIAGAKTIDGVMMLVHQGAESFRIWTSKSPPVGVMERAVRDALK